MDIVRVSLWGKQSFLSMLFFFRKDSIIFSAEWENRKVKDFVCVVVYFRTLLLKEL